MFLIVPNHISDAIKKELDEAIARTNATLREDEYNFFYQTILEYNEHGSIPEVSLTK